ncbi:hypothetical protein H5410_048675, partial [Solanum commersonii]
MLRVVSDFISFTGEFASLLRFTCRVLLLRVVMVKQTKVKQALLSCILCRVETNSHPLVSRAFYDGKSHHSFLCVSRAYPFLKLCGSLSLPDWPPKELISFLLRL